MEQYEIIVQQAQGSALLLTAEGHHSDKDAIRSARKIAHGRQFEVWRGEECVTGFMRPLNTDESALEPGRALGL